MLEMSTILPSSQASVPATAIGQDPPRNRSGRMLRKRVKTGCLTCRKRRIKCGEQKPSCYNCIKSKRECDYNTRLEFKNLPALGETVSPEFGQSFSATFLNTGLVPASYHPQHVGYTSNAPPLTPQTPSYPRHPSQPTPTAFISPSSSLPQQPFTFESNAVYPSPAVSLTPSFPPYQIPGRTEEFVAGTPTYSSFPRQAYASLNFDRSVTQAQWPPQPTPVSSAASGPPPTTQTLHHEVPAEEHGGFPSHSPTYSDEHAFPNKRRNVQSSVYGSAPRSVSFDEYGGYYRSARPDAPSFGRPDHTTVLEMAAVEIEDDEYYDLLPGEEEGYPVTSGANSFALPSIDSFSNGAFHPSPSIVGMYNESQAANPLKNQATQMVFRNFIWHTAPALSVFERPSARAPPVQSPSNMFGTPISCWMDLLPKMALHDPGLLHAMLAQSSYEIAKAQGASTTPSGKHYAWSLRRVHRALDSPGKRHHITTLAATLLLGFYEILTADHLKWSTHLSGARGLIVESNYKAMTREVRRRLRVGHGAGGYPHSAEGGAYGMESMDDQSFREPDQALVEQLMGFKVMDMPDPGQTQFYAPVDLNLFPVQQDLFWWYCRQDAYHSIISGNDLLLPYHRWADCPPRAPLGQQHAVYGSSDYLLLLLGRIASFAANDRPRKIKVNKMQPPRPPSGKPPTPVTPQGQSPPFYGMAPSSGQPQLPRAYGTESIETVSNDKHMNSSPGKLETATALAYQEWNDIHAACDAFARRLGPEFRPLSLEGEPPFQTPFGFSCHFRSHEIATLWLIYYMSMLVLIRAHPAKPAAAHVSVGVSARETAWYANEIGRIAAGITPPGVHSEKHYKFLGAYTGSVVPLFFAGVQYQDGQQRLWTVQRLLGIAHTCGWTTAETCANGCETSWVRAAEMGRGTPWTRISQDLSSPDQRLSLKYLHPSGGQPVDPLDRRLLPYQPDSRLLWGFGLLGTIEDLGNVSLND